MRTQMALLEDHCPYCGELISLLIDCSVDQQNYIEDCSVCCHPITIAVTVKESGIPIIQLWHEDD